MEHLRRAHPSSRIAANVVYNEYINDRWVGGRVGGEWDGGCHRALAGREDWWVGVVSGRVGGDC